jgi:hypothetical protein
LVAISGALTLLLLAFSGGYGYHRDELYFLVAGKHLAWGYADQGPLTPVVAHVMDLVAPGSLTALRAPSALMAGATALVTGLIACEFGGGRRVQLIAAGSMAVASVLLVVGHLLSTSSFDLLAWTLVTWLVARICRTGDPRLWPVAGAVTGLALLNKPLIAFLAGALGVAIIAAGPREVLRSRWLVAGVCIAAALWAPWLAWQAANGWPQLEVSSAIAAGGSASSQPRWAFIPFQFLLVSPLLAPVWIAGLLALWRRAELRRFRSFALAWLLLLGAFLGLGGKPYYLSGLFPVLLAAGALETERWLRNGRRRMRSGLLTGALVLSGLVSAVIALPILPVREVGAVVAINPDIGETIGWPELVHAVAGAYGRSGRRVVIFTSNYGEAGAIDRYGPALGLPSAYSGHNAFSWWGPPQERAATSVVTVGLSSAQLRRFSRCRVVARVTNRPHVDNDERGEPIARCAGGVRGTWRRLWARLRRLG